MSKGVESRGACTSQPSASAHTTTAELFWHTRSLAQLTLPVLGEDEFRRHPATDHPCPENDVGASHQRYLRAVSSPGC